MDRKITKRLVLSLLARALGSVAGLFLTFFVTRILDLDEAGYYFAGLSAALILSAFGKFGLDTLLLRESSGETTRFASDLPALLSKATRTCSIALSIAAIMALWISNEFLETSSVPRVAICAVFLLANSLSVLSISAEALRGLGKSGQSFLLQYSLWPVLTAATALTLSTSDPIGLLAVAAGCTTISAVACFLLARARLPKSPSPHKHRDFPTRHFLREGRPFFLVTVLNLANTGAIPSYLLATVANTGSVAELAVALRISSLLALVFTATNAVVAGRTAQAFREDRLDHLQFVNRQATKFAILVVFPLSAMILFFNDPILTEFGDDYRHALPSLVILITGQLVNVSTGAAGQTLLLCGKQTTAVKTLAVGSSITILLTVLLASSYQTTGAAIAITTGTVSIQFLNYWACHRGLGVALSPFLRATKPLHPKT